jgi:septal ring factor EnvC (AmiA/AmiB activator)
MISQMQAEVEQMTKSLESKKNEAAGFAEKLNATKQEFEVAMKSIAGQIAEDIQKMNQYLK